MPDTSGPMFPTPRQERNDGPVWMEPGMTLRDYFAGQALQGVLANPHVAVAADAPAGTTHEQAVVQAVFALADAMLAERRKEPSGG